MCRLYGKFASCLRRVLCKTRLIFPRINGPNVLLLLFSFKSNLFGRAPPRGGYFRNSGVGMCHWDSGTLSLYQSSFKRILLPYTRLNSQTLPLSLSQSSCFPETTEVTNTVQPKQIRFDFFHIFECQFPVSLV